jgi:chromosome segregation ATPase
MILLLTQIWGFLLIAWLIGMIMGGLFMQLKRSVRLTEVEQHLRDSRERGIASEKELGDLRAKLGELEGIPEAERRSRIAAREELIGRIAKLETDLSLARNMERQAREEAEEQRRQARSLSAQLTEERNKPAPVLELTPALADTSAWDEEIAALKSKASEAERLAETKTSEAASLKSKLVELEGRVARSLDGARDAEAFRSRVLELEAQIRQEQNASAERFTALSAKNAELEAKLKDRDSAIRGPLLDVAELAGLRRDAEQMVVWKTKANDLEMRLSSFTDAREEATELRQRVSRLETELAAAARDNSAIQEYKTKITDLETRLSADQSRAASELLRLKDELRSARTEADIASAKLAESETRLEPMRNAAVETETLKAKLASAELKIDALERETGDTATLKARNAELEARLRELDLTAKSAGHAAAEANSLKARITDLERRLVDAHRAQDEAAILRAQVAEMDGRLGQALRQAAEAETLRAKLAALETKPV